MEMMMKERKDRNPKLKMNSEWHYRYTECVEGTQYRAVIDGTLPNNILYKLNVNVLGILRFLASMS